MPVSAGYREVGRMLRERLREPAPGRIQLLTGPRQVGKTTLLLQLLEEYGSAALYLAADAPEATLPGWWEAQWQTATRIAKEQTAVIMLDEIQYLPQWSRLLKVEIDRVYRFNLPIQVVVTGSASLALGSGGRETMAGRFERLEIPQWSPRDLAEGFNLSPEQAVETYVRFGSFPRAVRLIDDHIRWQAYLRDSIIDPAIGRDLLQLESVRKPALLRQVFAICAGHPSEVVSLNKIAGLLNEAGAMATIAHYLHLLEDAYLVTTAMKYSAAPLRQRATPPKLIPLSNAFATSGLPAAPPTRETHPALWGRWVENACLAYAWAHQQEVHYWREEPLEVDGVLQGDWGQWALEIKTGPYSMHDLKGLLEFCRRYPDFRPLVVGDEEHGDAAQRLGIDCVSWQAFLWDGVAGL